MKRFIILAALLLASAVSARAVEVTVAAKSFPGYNYAGATAKLRIYPSNTFTGSDGSTVIPGGTAPGSTSGFFYTVNCTVASNVLSCPAVTLHSTTDSPDKPDTTYTVVLFEAAGGKRDFFPLSNFRLTHTLGASVTWSQIINDNTGRRNRPDPGVYTIDQTNALVTARIAEVGAVGNAATTEAIGRLKVSATPENAAAPVAVEADDRAWPASFLVLPQHWPQELDAGNPRIKVASLPGGNPLEATEQYAPGAIKLPDGSFRFFPKGSADVDAWMADAGLTTYSLLANGVIAPTGGEDACVEDVAVPDPAASIIHHWWKCRAAGVWAIRYGTSPIAAPTTITRNPSPVLTSAAAAAALGAGGTVWDLSIGGAIKVGSTWHFFGHFAAGTFGNSTFYLWRGQGSSPTSIGSITEIKRSGPSRIITSPRVYKFPRSPFYVLLHSEGDFNQSIQNTRHTSVMISRDLATWQDTQGPLLDPSGTTGWDAQETYAVAFAVSDTTGEPVSVGKRYPLFYSGLDDTATKANTGVAWLTPGRGRQPRNVLSGAESRTPVMTLKNTHGSNADADLSRCDDASGTDWFFGSNMRLGRVCELLQTVSALPSSGLRVGRDGTVRAYAGSDILAPTETFKAGVGGVTSSGFRLPLGTRVFEPAQGVWGLTQDATPSTARVYSQLSDTDSTYLRIGFPLTGIADVSTQTVGSAFSITRLQIGTGGPQPFKIYTNSIFRWGVNETTGAFESEGGLAYNITTAGTITGGKLVTNNSAQWTSGNGSPEGVVAASQGSLYTRLDPVGIVLYVKESGGAGNTGWVATSGGGGGLSGLTTGRLLKATSAAAAGDSLLAESANGFIFGAAPTASATKSYFNFSTTDIVGGDADGTLIGANEAGSAKDFFNFQVAGVSVARLTGEGDATFKSVTTTGAGYSNFASQSDPGTPAAGDFWRNGPDYKFYDGAAVRTFATTDATQALTNKTFSAEATGNVLTTVEKLWLPAAGCNNATAGSMWDLPAATPAAAACVTGTNIQKGVLDFADTSGGFSAQNTLLLPSDFTGSFDARIIWTTVATTGNAKWSLSTICTAVDGTETDDPAFNTASTVVTAAPGTASRVQTSSITGLTATGCAANKPLLHLKIFRDGADAADTIAATARLIGVEFTFRRAQ